MILLLLEAYLSLGWARVLKALPFSKVAPSLGAQMQETEMICSDAEARIIKRIGHVIAVASRFTPWESVCMVRALAASRMLERRGISSTLYMGTGKDKTGKMIAHAWLRSGPIYVTGAEVMRNYAVVGMFARTIPYKASRRSMKYG
ncbi:lasso peptide biosynthesis B2 protein [Gorillibacterium massiliense]|uniref:lasso peptide biosynthesis B2 protein n=1 Tax=Gorillibacterium massiliense TaxID=1280390 RepID=UPI0004B878F8|nr:lasso peptide biosynthesis B2 protein [Gorillibacterium massiliense]